jgi:hypothetical protein
MFCTCGFDLRESPRTPGLPEAILLSTLIEDHIEGSPSGDGDRVISLLSGLSLDGLCKTIWLLGHVLPTVLSGKTVRGRTKPTKEESSRLIAKAFGFLSSWPDSYLGALGEIADQEISKSSASYVDRLFRSVHRYLMEELDAPETAFLKSAYEYQIRKLWRDAGDRHALRNINRQLELRLDLPPQ